MPVPFSFGAATSAIPLSQLDSNFNTPITLGNTAIQLGNTVTTLNNMTLANVTISSGNVTITNVTVTTANATTVNTTTLVATTANVTTGNVTNLISGNVTLTGGSITGTTISGSTGSFTTLTTSSTVTLNGGTANGVAYLNGSKVLTTGSALTFDGTTLGVGVAGSAWDTLKAIDLGSGGAVYGTAGQGGITSNAFYGASGFVYKATNGAGLYQLVADSHRWSTAASGTGGTAITFAEQMRLTSTGLGIGTSSPDSKLVVQGGSGTYAQIKDGTVNTFIQARSADSVGVVGTLTNHSLAFWTNSASRMTLDTSGNLGLGVTPSTWESTAKAFQFGSLGYVARGSSGQTMLGYNNYLNTSNQYIYSATSQASRYEQISGEHRWFNAASGTAGNAITFTQAMTLDASGNLLLNRTSQWSNEQFAISGSSSTQRFTYFRSTAAGHYLSLGTNGTLPYIEFGNGAGLAFNDGSTERARITSAGSFVAGGSVALATTATDGFLYVPTCAGTPTGTPTAITGMAPIVVNTTNNKLYFYSGGAWRDAGP